MATKNTDWSIIDTPVEHQGRSIVLPALPTEMDHDTAIKTLERVKAQENQEFDIFEVVPGFPWDALAAISRAMHAIYGVVMAESQMSWFGEIRPKLVTIHTGSNPEDTVQVVMGQMALPNVDNPVHVDMNDEGAAIYGRVKRKQRSILIDIANKAREIMRTDSLYKGTAVRLGVDEDGELELGRQPEFLDLRAVQESDAIHTKDTEALIRTNIYAPLKFTDACRRNKIPLKRGILLEGRYGTGKSLTARVTAKVATDNGWTFIMLDRAVGLKAAIELGRTYQPCVIFAEDIDRAADRSEESVNDLVNMLDGLITKDKEMMVVLTTNFIENIDKSLLRPGRFDAVISIQVPDADTAERLIRAYARDLLSDSEDLTNVGTVVAGQIPATIREVVERAKLSMLTEGREFLNADDLYVSAIGMKAHMDLLNPKEKDESPVIVFYDALRNLLVSASGDGNTDIAEKLNAIDRRTDKAASYDRAILEEARATKRIATGAGAAAEVAKENTERLLAAKR